VPIAILIGLSPKNFLLHLQPGRFYKQARGERDYVQAGCRSDAAEIGKVRSSTNTPQLMVPEPTNVCARHKVTKSQSFKLDAVLPASCGIQTTKRTPAQFHTSLRRRRRNIALRRRNSQ
jgi:hypothetical protein